MPNSMDIHDRTHRIAPPKRGELWLLRDDGRSICERCAVAATPLTRLKGLLGRGVLELAAGETERRGLRAGDRLRFAEPSGTSA